MSARKTWVRWLLALLLLLVCVALAATVVARRWIDAPLPLAKPSVDAFFEPGTAPREVAQRWVSAGVQVPAEWLFLWFRLSGDAKRIRAGSYSVETGATPRSLLQKMVDGDQTMETVRLIEGWTMRQWRQALGKAAHLKPTTATMSDDELMAAIGAAGVPPEGRFFPDTYRYARGVADVSVLKRAYAQMDQRLTAAWAARAADLPLKSADEALILASIVEKETGRATDRGLIAGVFHNRLRIDMPLQTDPTVIYGLGPAFDGNLRKRDLLSDTPYNTYTRRGLPPTPIAMPGAEALAATMQPQATKALYFVARGDGSSAFSETLAEHNRAVNEFQRKGQP
jgi:UPF0755 protein